MNTFTKDAGRFLKKAESDAMTDTYRARKREMGIKDDECVRSEFFGLDQVMQLLNKPGCVGLRIHQAKRREDGTGTPDESGSLKPRVLLTAVDERGRDITARSAQTGLKDDPDDDDSTLGSGYTCPQHCGQ
ncbi:hypothetical protein [Spirosoma rhododendri]|uniref:Uncharacterized protein n=1 Tax=Spirosoma rhododendri TaxID=2728024 RepID=A0A7L5DRW9_9BACT|nr:hypothetical protein [Spirosoma rhododendri]QJD78390.1 hypothetical protein HH216_08115 [Spirosoma rhododendri]